MRGAFSENGSSEVGQDHVDNGQQYRVKSCLAQGTRDRQGAMIRLGLLRKTVCNACLILIRIRAGTRWIFDHSNFKQRFGKPRPAWGMVNAVLNTGRDRINAYSNSNMQSAWVVPSCLAPYRSFSERNPSLSVATSKFAGAIFNRKHVRVRSVRHYLRLSSKLPHFAW